MIVTGGKNDPLLPHLIKAINQADEIDLAVSFIRQSGLNLILPALKEALLQPVELQEVGSNAVYEDYQPSGVKIRILTSDYLNVTDPESLRLMTQLQEYGANVKVYQCTNESFHLKTYLFARTRSGQIIQADAFVGSSNISKMALEKGLEWNYHLEYKSATSRPETLREYQEMVHHFQALFSQSQAINLTHDWIDAYEKRRPTRVDIFPSADSGDEREAHPEPHPIQTAALAALEQSRAEGYQRGLVVMATGLGKTYLAAYDAKAFQAKRILFVAHREEILNQSAETFLRVIGKKRAGFYQGKERDVKADILFASIQTLGREQHLNQFTPDHFDYMVVDEFHHTAAKTYQRLLRYFHPKFLLGLTATPDRTDQSNILSFCDDNLVFRCDLFEGIERKLLCPFNYYGILDEVDYSQIPWRNGRFDPTALTAKLATRARAHHALREWQEKSGSRTLAFCVSKKHADYMSTEFNRQGVKSVSVHSGSEVKRNDAIDQLKHGNIAVLFCVDLFNEGVDVPEIDTVMMLRPTESRILFLQQLGRGLRWRDGKTLKVLDFIANHKSFINRARVFLDKKHNELSLPQIAKKAKELRFEDIDLPFGCFVNFPLQFIDFLVTLDGNELPKQYESLKEALGRRPTLTEFHRSDASIQKVHKEYGSWWEMVSELEGLSDPEQLVLSKSKNWFKEIETTSMSKSFKMVLLESLIENNGLNSPPTLEELARQSRQVFQRRRNLIDDVQGFKCPFDQITDKAWFNYWRQNPMRAWLGENSKKKNAWFEIKDKRFVPRFEINSTTPYDVFETMLMELLEYRLAAYERRAEPVIVKSPDNLLPFTPQAPKVELPYYPNLQIACGHFKTSNTEVEEYCELSVQYERIDPSRHFVARASGNSMNGGKNPICDGDYLLLEKISSTSAGSITNNILVIERQDQSGDNQYLLRKVTKLSDGKYVLKANNLDYPDLLANESMRTFARFKKNIPQESIVHT